MLAAGLVVGVLVERGARRREQHDLPRPRRGARCRQRALEVAGVVERHPGARQRGRELRRGLADQVGRAGALGHRRGERRVVAALAAAAEDHVHAAREGLEPGDRRGDVRGLGVVDVEHPVERRDLLEPVRDAGEAREPLADRGGRHPAGERDGSGGHRVEAVVRPAQPDLLDAHQALPVPPQRVLARREAGAGAGPEPDALGLPGQALRRELLRRDGHRAGRLAGEHLELGGAIGVEGAVAVEVVLGEVEQHPGVGREALGVLELERRRLADDRRRLRQPAIGERGERRPDVAHDLRGQARRAVQVADQLDRGRLAVGAGDRDQLVGHEPPADLELPDHGQPRLARRDDDGRLRRHAGALDHRADRRRAARPRASRRGPRRRPPRAPRAARPNRPRVAAGDRRAAAAQRERHRDAGAGEPHDEVGTGWERRPREHARHCVGG